LEVGLENIAMVPAFSGKSEHQLLILYIKTFTGY